MASKTKEQAAAEDEQAREILQTAIASLTFLVGMAAIATDIDEDLDTKVDAKSIGGTMILGQVAFNFAAAALVAALCTYGVIITLTTISMKGGTEAERFGFAFRKIYTARLIWVTIAVIFFMFLIGVFLMVVFFMQLTNYRGRGPDICPIDEAGENGEAPKPFSLCGVTGNDLHFAAGTACSGASSAKTYSKEFKDLGFDITILCQEYYDRFSYTDEPEKELMFESMFVWNSPLTDYTYRRSAEYFKLVDQATATYCQKDVAWSLRKQSCPLSSRTNGTASLPDKQLCAVAMEAALSADECQASKKADVESCFMHCAGKFHKGCKNNDDRCPKKSMQNRLARNQGAKFDDWKTSGHILCVLLALAAAAVPIILISCFYGCCRCEHDRDCGD